LTPPVTCRSTVRPIRPEARNRPKN